MFSREKCSIDKNFISFVEILGNLLQPYSDLVQRYSENDDLFCIGWFNKGVMSGYVSICTYDNTLELRSIHILAEQQYKDVVTSIIDGMFSYCIKLNVLLYIETAVPDTQCIVHRLLNKYENRLYSVEIVWEVDESNSYVIQFFGE